MNSSNNYCVYVLIKDKKPIYVGSSSNIENRIKSHKVLKDFDEFFIIKKYETKEESLTAENVLIRFISLFGGKEWLNSKDKNLLYRGFFNNYNNCLL
jgi:hypothetical protein